MAANLVSIFISDVGEFVIPDSVISEAESLNGVRPVDDWRTQGFKFIEAWGKSVRDQWICGGEESGVA